ncbi:hypothetical protein [Celerinatantimonas sp. MCCC 1A17872]|uniref:hypothetical protein n=1 Tax=Celerinatantimonas sp. MCCC 1A17872 TaxID=3177514 RepID=UPI0038C7DCCA
MKQSQWGEIVGLLCEAVDVLVSEGLEQSVKDTEKLLCQMKSKGSVVPSHRAKLYSILRMMLESNSYYNCKAKGSLEHAYDLMSQALDEKC